MVGTDSIVWIHKELGEMDKMDRAKIGIEFYAANLKGRSFTNKEVEELIGYFSREMRDIKLNFNQTS